MKLQKHQLVMVAIGHRSCASVLLVSKEETGLRWLVWMAVSVERATREVAGCQGMGERAICDVYCKASLLVVLWSVLESRPASRDVETLNGI